MANLSDLHVLDFFLDDENSCALTVYSDQEHVRYHIIADADKLQSSSKTSSNDINSNYLDLVQAIRDGGNAATISPSSDHDSGVGMSSPLAQPGSPSSKTLASTEDAEDALQGWILASLASHRKDHQHHDSPATVQEYYDAETRFFELSVESTSLCATELEADADLKRRMAKLNPEITLPKYIRQLDLPWYSASDLEVLDGSSSPPPYHPTRVRHRESGETYFFKSAIGEAPQVTKREINLLHRIGKPDICDQICAPRLKGLVGSGDSKTKALGFLQSEIQDPVPLTEKIDVDIPQEQRDAWATEAERMKEVLHDHDIIWGDAKADNFLVDRDDVLWLIDMGGSYTEGWIDPELADTEEGDDQGVEKVVNALHDPVANTMDPDEEAQTISMQDDEGVGSEAETENEAPEADFQPTPARGQKRKADTESGPAEEVDQDQAPASKFAKHESDGTSSEAQDLDSDEAAKQNDEEEPKLYCYCHKSSEGRMIACDSSDCRLKWIHFACAGLEDPPPADEKWFCKECRA
jgi:hypothetical protein